MTLAYVVIAALAASNLVTLFVLYKLVSQLSSKVMSGSIERYSVATAVPREEKRQGKAIHHQELVAIDQVDPEELMRTLAEDAGRADEWS